jgi:hypothetical protein
MDNGQESPLLGSLDLHPEIKFSLNVNQFPFLCLSYSLITTLGAPFQGQSGRGVKLTTHLQLLQRSRKRGPMHSPTKSSWYSA